MEEDYGELDLHHIKSWETYKILNKIKGSVQQKRKAARDVYVH